jgi:hypothetical protein
MPREVKRAKVVVTEGTRSFPPVTVLSLPDEAPFAVDVMGVSV